jgi:hypothetical protein
VCIVVLIYALTRHSSPYNDCVAHGKKSDPDVPVRLVEEYCQQQFGR